MNDLERLDLKCEMAELVATFNDHTTMEEECCMAFSSEEEAAQDARGKRIVEIAGLLGMGRVIL